MLVATAAQGRQTINNIDNYTVEKRQVQSERMYVNGKTHKADTVKWVLYEILMDLNIKQTS